MVNNLSALRFFLYLVYIESALIYAYKLYKNALFVTLICGMLVDSFDKPLAS